MKDRTGDSPQNSEYTPFLGCTVPVRALNYEISARKVAEKLGLRLSDVPDFSCCGYPIKSVHRYASLLMAARNLALAEKKGLPLCTLCSACCGALTEANHENRSFCCGAGGGRMWLEENIGKRINQMRTGQVIQTKAAVIGTAYPYCLTMLRDGTKEMGQEKTLTVFDLSELVEQSI